MTQLFMGNALWHLIMQSDWICKGVMLILLGMSIVCWTIFLYKWLALRKRKQHITQALQELKMVRSLDDLVALSVRHTGTAAGYFLTHCLTHAKVTIERNKERGVAGLTLDDREAMQQNAYQMVDELVMQDEAYLPFLSGSAAVSPLLGLFGTVWGLVHAFVRISEKQTADIATVAPGIAEALITTLAGLVIAIPALVMFVYLSSQARKLEQHYTTLADRYVQLLNRFVA